MFQSRSPSCPARRTPQRRRRYRMRLTRSYTALGLQPLRTRQPMRLTETLPIRHPPQDDRTHDQSLRLVQGPLETTEASQRVFEMGSFQFVSGTDTRLLEKP